MEEGGAGGLVVVFADKRGTVVGQEWRGGLEEVEKTKLQFIIF